MGAVSRRWRDDPHVREHSRRPSRRRAPGARPPPGPPPEAPALQAFRRSIRTALRSIGLKGALRLVPAHLQPRASVDRRGRARGRSAHPFSPVESIALRGGSTHRECRRCSSAAAQHSVGPSKVLCLRDRGASRQRDAVRVYSGQGADRRSPTSARQRHDLVLPGLFDAPTGARDPTLLRECPDAVDRVRSSPGSTPSPSAEAARPGSAACPGHGLRPWPAQASADDPPFTRRPARPGRLRRAAAGFRTAARTAARTSSSTRSPPGLNPNASPSGHRRTLRDLTATPRRGALASGRSEL